MSNEPALECFIHTLSIGQGCLLPLDKVQISRMMASSAIRAAHDFAEDNARIKSESGVDSRRRDILDRGCP